MTRLEKVLYISMISGLAILLWSISLCLLNHTFSEPIENDALTKLRIQINRLEKYAEDEFGD